MILGDFEGEFKLAQNTVLMRVLEKLCKPLCKPRCKLKVIMSTTVSIMYYKSKT